MVMKNQIAGNTTTGHHRNVQFATADSTLEINVN
jgi:hypothetical protein